MTEVVLHHLLACHLVGTPAGNNPAFEHADDAVSDLKRSLQVLLDEAKQAALSKQLATHEKAHPPVVLKRRDGRVIAEGTLESGGGGHPDSGGHDALD